jgi:hypothetical protein
MEMLLKLLKGFLAIIFVIATLSLVNMSTKIVTVFWATDPFLVITVIGGFLSLFVAWMKLLFAD